MMTVDTVDGAPTKPRGPKKFYDVAFKARVVAECQLPNASIAGVALRNGVNANVLHRWRDESDAGIGWARRKEIAPQFVAIQMQPPAPVSQPMPPALISNETRAAGDIQIEVMRGTSRIVIKWPMASADACKAWLTQLEQ
jgi:transposase